MGLLFVVSALSVGALTLLERVKGLNAPGRT